ncbi:MAG TPA: ATP-binding protein [Thermoanaerobaculia bacterium]|nr:ATP-binding protein [Thermoanaerobaculia bacterium]
MNSLLDDRLRPETFRPPDLPTPVSPAQQWVVELDRVVVETACGATAVVDRAGRLRHHNAALEKLLLRDTAALTGSELPDLVSVEDREAVRAAVARQLGEPHARGHVAARLPQGDGGFLPVELTIMNIVFHGEIAGLVVHVREAGQCQGAAERRERSERLASLGRLAATVAHEFNNVLMGIQPFAELLQKAELTDAMRAKTAYHIGNSVRRGKRVAQDILRYTQATTPEATRLDLAEWWQRLLPEVQAQTGYAIDLSWSFPAGLAVHGDASQLAQVFTNLLNNARDAMPRGGSLTVTAREPSEGETFPFAAVDRPESFVLVTVADSGSGIAPDVLTFIFEPLFTTKPSGGTGLGLAVAHQVVERHGGHIFVESEPGEGTAFHVFLPRATAVERTS